MDKKYTLVHYGQMAAKKSAQKYKRNFLTSVILRLDFNNIELPFLEGIAKKIKAEFPVQEQKEGVKGSLMFDIKSGKVEQSREKNITWNFWDAKKRKHLTIANTYLLLEYASYKNSGEFKKDIRDAVSLFLTESKLESIQRVGLRYTNEIDLKEVKDLKWGDYFQQSLLGGLAFADAASIPVARSMGQLVLKEEIADILFNFGIWNVDFPNENVRKEFLLDFDCYSRFPVSLPDVNFPDLIETYNSYINELFESSIKPAFRTILKK